MEIRPRETVVLAADFPALVAWYRDVLGFEVVKRFDQAFHYANLETRSGIKLGIGDAAEMGVELSDRANNTVVLQVEVDDVRAFLAEVSSKGGTVTLGPSYDENGGFWFGGFADPEGNPIWVVDASCP